MKNIMVGIKSIFSKMLKKRGLSKNYGVDYRYINKVGVHDRPIYDDIYLNTQFYQGKINGFHNTQFNSGIAKFYIDKITNKVVGNIEDYEFKINDKEIDESVIDIISSPFMQTNMIHAYKAASALGGSLLRININDKLEYSTNVVYADFFYPTFENGKLTAAEIHIETLDVATSTEYYFLREKRFYDNKTAMIQYDIIKCTIRGNELNETVYNNSKYKDRINVQLGEPMIFGNGKWIGLTYFKANVINSQFRTSSFGESDITPAAREFMLTIDRTYTQYYDEAELGKAIGFMPKSMIKDKDGNIDIESNVFHGTNGGSIDGNNKPELFQADVRYEMFQSRIIFLTDKLFESNGYDPNIFLNRIQTAEEISQAMEEQFSTIRQRRVLFKETLEEFFKNYLIMTGLITPDSKVKITVPDVMMESAENKTKILNAQIAGKLKSIDKAVKELNPKMADNELQLEVARIKHQNMLDLSDEEDLMLGTSSEV